MKEEPLKTLISCSSFMFKDLICIQGTLLSRFFFGRPLTPVLKA